MKPPFLRLFKKVLSAGLVIALCQTSAHSQNELNVVGNWIQYSDAPNSTYRHLSSQAYDLLLKRRHELQGLRSLADWQQRQQRVRKSLSDIIGPLPEKTPLNATVTKTLHKDGYTIEHIVYESQPQFFVTSSLFIPDSIKTASKRPAILYCSGHSDDGYRNPAYQQAILNLVQKGFIVFAFDPVSQGERLEYIDPATGKPMFEEPDKEHSYSGAQPFILGSSLARYMIWDGIRALDYLLTRKEVDPSRIGITGRSGGGTQSAYIAALDDRIKAVATENYITNFTRLIQSSGPQDAEQDLFNAIRQDIDLGDLLTVRAPKPALVISTSRDLTFSIQGAMETAKEVSVIYQAYGKKTNFGFVSDDAAHATTPLNRQAMYAFFQKHLDNPGDPADHKVKLLTAEELQVSPTGQVFTSYHGATIFSLNKQAAEKLEAKLTAQRKDLPGYLTRAVGSAKKLSGYHPPIKTDEPVFTGRFQKDGYVLEKYFIKGEGDYIIPYLLFKPEHPNHKALVYLNPLGKSAQAHAGQDLEWFAGKGFTVLAPDLLGTGEMGPGVFHGDSYIQGVSYNVWFLSMLIGRSITGIQASDLGKLTDLLKRNQDTHEVYGLAFGELAPVLLHAAAFDPAITHIGLVGSCSSYREVVMNRFYNVAYVSGTVPGALKAYDLPDLAASLAPRKLMITAIKDGTGKNADLATVNEDLSVVSAAYHYRHADEMLQTDATGAQKKLKETFEEWIR